MSERLFFPATERNRDAIFPHLKAWARPGLMLEIGSGSGEHAAYMVPQLEGVTWLPTDLDDAHVASIAAWREHTGHARFLSPRRLNVTEPWALDDAVAAHGPVTTIFTANVIHIAPPEVMPALIKGAGAQLSLGGRLIFYGPFMEAGQHTSPSNIDFDAWLKKKDPSFGIKDRFVVEEVAADAGFTLMAVEAMPANNFMLMFEKTA